MTLTEFMEEIERDFPGLLGIYGQAPFEEAWKKGLRGVEATNAALVVAFEEERR